MANKYDQDLNLRSRYPQGKWWSLLNELESAATRLMHLHLCERYGSGPAQKVDIFPAKNPNAPVLVFIHGGYFRSLDKRSYSFIARTYVKQGFTVALLNYDLCPSVSVEQIYEQVIQGFRWLKRHIHCWNGDPNKMVLSGHSVGACLVSHLLGELSGHQNHGVKLAVLLSGIYNLEVLRDSYLNTSIKLSQSEAERLNQMRPISEQSVPVLVAVGADETGEFVRQSKAYFGLQKKSTDQLLLLSGHNHYTVPRVLASSQSDLYHAILASVS